MISFAFVITWVKFRLELISAHFFLPMISCNELSITLSTIWSYWRVCCHCQIGECAVNVRLACVLSVSYRRVCCQCQSCVCAVSVILACVLSVSAWLCPISVILACVMSVSYWRVCCQCQLACVLSVSYQTIVCAVSVRLARALSVSDWRVYCQSQTGVCPISAILACVLSVSDWHVCCQCQSGMCAVSVSLYYRLLMRPGINTAVDKNPCYNGNLTYNHKPNYNNGNFLLLRLKIKQLYLKKTFLENLDQNRAQTYKVKYILALWHKTCLDCCWNSNRCDVIVLIRWKIRRYHTMV